MSNKIARRELVDLITARSKEWDLTKDAVHEVLDSMIDVIRLEAKKGRSVYLRGLGTFSKVVREPRVINNIATGKKKRVPRRAYPLFTVSRTWKHEIRGAK